MQEELPKDMGDCTILTECEIRNNNLELVASYCEEEFSFDDALIELFLESMKEELKNDFMNDDTIKEMLSLCKNEGKGFRFIFKGEKSGKSIVLIEVTHDELLKDDSL